MDACLIQTMLEHAIPKLLVNVSNCLFKAKASPRAVQTLLLAGGLIRCGPGQDRRKCRCFCVIVCSQPHLVATCCVPPLFFREARFGLPHSSLYGTSFATRNFQTLRMQPSSELHFYQRFCVTYIFYFLWF